MKEADKITSRNNQRIKHARSVMLGSEPGLIFIEGVRLVEEALKSGIEIVEVFVTDNSRKQALLCELALGSYPVWEISESVAGSISDTKNPQGIFIIARRPDWTLADVDDILLAVYLHEINNPANLGAIVRTAEAAGVSAVVVSKGSADPFSTKSLRGAMGSAFRLPVFEGIDAEEILKWARERRLITTAADIAGKTSYTDADWSKPRLLIFGSEAHGLDDDLKGSVDELITIPMKNGVESLNLAVSAGVILFEAARQNPK
jgi:TrmH family RNA methyltransferase